MDTSVPTLTISGINYLAVFVAVLAVFALGFLWYSKALFMERWMKGAHLKEKDVQQANMPIVFGGTFVVSFIGALTLAALMQALGFDTLLEGATFGLLVGGGFLATTRVMHALYEQKPVDYTVITLGNDVLNYALMGAIIGALS